MEVYCFWSKLLRSLASHTFVQMCRGWESRQGFQTGFLMQLDSFFQELWKPFKYRHRIYVGLGILQWHRGASPYNWKLHLICLQLPFPRNLDVTHCCKVMGVALLSQSRQRLCLCQADSSNPHYTHIVMRRCSAQMSYKGSRERKH